MFAAVVDGTYSSLIHRSLQKVTAPLGGVLLRTGSAYSEEIIILNWSNYALILIDLKIKMCNMAGNLQLNVFRVRKG